MVTLSGRHQRRSLKLFKNEDYLQWAVKPCFIRYAFRIDGKSIFLAPVTKMSRIAKISTVFVRRKPGFTNTIQSVLSYAQAFEQNFRMSFVDARVLDIIHDLTSSNLLAANSQVTYARKMRLANMTINEYGVLPLLVGLALNVPVVKTLGLTHLAN